MAIFNAFPCKFVPYFRRYVFFLLFCVGYGRAVPESCWYESIEGCFYELASKNNSADVVYVGLPFLLNL